MTTNAAHILPTIAVIEQTHAWGDCLKADSGEIGRHCHCSIEVAAIRAGEPRTCRFCLEVVSPELPADEVAETDAEVEAQIDAEPVVAFEVRSGGATIPAATANEAIRIAERERAAGRGATVVAPCGHGQTDQLNRATGRRELTPCRRCVQIAAAADVLSNGGELTGTLRAANVERDARAHRCATDAR
jgi:hypothetical protein